MVFVETELDCAFLKQVFSNNDLRNQIKKSNILVGRQKLLLALRSTTCSNVVKKL